MKRIAAVVDNLGPTQSSFYLIKEFNKKSIVEGFKEKTPEGIKLKKLNLGENYGKSIKFKGFY